MATEIIMPDLGTSVDRVRLIKWLKQEGEFVKRGELLCEIETDKAVSELESFAEGFLLRREVEDDSEIEAGSVIAYIGREGEEVPDSTEVNELNPVQNTEDIKTETSASTSEVSTRKKISPMIKNLAKREGVDLNVITGTGPGGRITREDVINARELGDNEHDNVELLSTNQSIVASQVTRSHREIPSFCLTCRIEMSATIEKRGRLRDEQHAKVCYDAFFIEAVAEAMRDFPHFRSQFTDDGVNHSEKVNVGIAVGIDHKLFIPVVKDAADQSLLELDANIRRLSDAAKQDSLGTEDISGATLTVSNLGMFPVHSFQAIIPPGQIAILAVGAMEETPVVKNGKIEIIPLAIVSLTVDHRLVNGREAGEFVKRLKGEMEKNEH